jgi:hypothetical protein
MIFPALNITILMVDKPHYGNIGMAGACDVEETRRHPEPIPWKR